jgi:glycosyltransferase involved in cell wall biosynthesis
LREEGKAVRIVIDVTTALEPGAGIAQATRELIQALARVDRGNEYCLYYQYFRRKGRTPLAIDQGNFTRVVNRLPWPLVNWLAMPIETFTGQADVIHGPAFFLRTKNGAKTVLTIYDLAFMLFPECYMKPSLEKLLREVPRCVQKANLIIAISQSTKEGLVNLLGISPQKIRVVPLAVASRFRVVEDEALKEGIRHKYALPSRFFLFVGLLNPRKNGVRLIQAYHRLRSERGLPYKLVFVGARGWLYENVLAQIEELGLEKEVIFTGHVADEDLPLIYNLAEALVYPSVYEGFGLPILEAMACGTPVITSNVSASPEVAGGAALLVDPYNVDQLAEVMYKVASQDELRAHLTRRGLKRVRDFSWAKTALETLAVYEEAYNI